VAPIAPLPLNLIDGLRKAGFDLDQLAAQAGLTAEQLRRPLTEAQADRFFTVAYERVGNPAVGLTLGLNMRPELFGVVGFAAMTSPNFGAALARIARYNALVSGCTLDILLDGEQAEVRVRYDGPLRPYSRCRLDIQMGSLLAFGRTFTERQIVPLHLLLACPPPPHHALYAQVFACPARFGQPHDAIVFRRADLELPLVSGNPNMAGLFEHEAERHVAAWQAPPSTADQVREALRERLRGELASIGAVARELCVSERTLQRRLAQEGVRFTVLVDQTRLESARQYLATGRASLTEVAYLLGFADPNSFFRFFKRQTGVTPDEYRQRATAAPALRPIATLPREASPARALPGALPGAPPGRDPTPGAGLLQ